jgi:hypothetical protein
LAPESFKNILNRVGCPESQSVPALCISGHADRYFL